MDLSNLLQKAKNGITAVDNFFDGKKRYIGWGLALIAQIIPHHTVVGGSADWLSQNLSNIGVGLDVLSGLFVGAAGVKTYKEYKNNKLPSGIKGEGGN